MFATKIIPLLQEFFYDDLGKVRAVLSVGGSGSPFIESRHLTHAVLFQASATSESERHSYVVTSDDKWTIDAFRGIYQGLGVES